MPDFAGGLRRMEWARNEIRGLAEEMNRGVRSGGTKPTWPGPMLETRFMSTSSRRHGMAVASLILGILSIVPLGLIAGLPAIILGHLAYRRSRRAPEQFAGGGMAVAGFVMGYVSILTTFVLLGLLLPALAKYKARAQSIQCVHHMKQIGLAFRIWATDHQDQFPSTASTNLTGNAGPDNFEMADSSRVFEMLARELGSPKVLVCPGDGSKHPATGFGNLQAENVSYELESGPDVNGYNPGSILATCPVHGHELFCDGSVRQNRWR